jgi:hypothetical protein
MQWNITGLIWMGFLLHHYTRVSPSYLRGVKLVRKFKYIVPNPKWNTRKKMRRNEKSETYFCTVVRRSTTSLRTYMYHNKLGCEVRSRIQVSGLASCYTVPCNIVLRAYSRLTASCTSWFYAFIVRNVHTHVVIWSPLLSVCFTKTREVKFHSADVQ